MNELEKNIFTQYFKHLNYSQAKYFLNMFGYDISDFEVIVAIRDPYARCISEFKYWLRNASSQEDMLRKKSVGVNNYLISLTRLYENGLYYFVGCENFDRVHVVKVEELTVQLSLIFKQFRLDDYLKVIQCDELKRVNETSEVKLDSSELAFCPETKDLIKKIFWFDFEYGKYPK